MRKYHNKKTVLNGRKFDSKKEARRFVELQMLEKKGLIKNLECQKKFELIPKQNGQRACNYIADFVYVDASNGQTVVEDVKGVRTEVYKIKKKLLLYFCGLDIHEI